MDGVANQEVRAPGQHKAPCKPRFINDRLQVRCQFRNALKLVEYGSVRVRVEESSGVFGKALPDIRALEVHVLQVIEYRAADSRFPGLPGAGHGNDRILPSEL